jgi:hypothetical protein
MLEQSKPIADPAAYFPVIVAEDATLHNYIANHAAVRPTIGYHEGETDFSPLFDTENRHLYRLLSDGIGVAMLFEWSAPGVWQTHTMALPHLRGAHCVKAMKAMLHHMATVEGARMVWGQTPTELRAARMLNRLIGGADAGTGFDAMGTPVTYYTWEPA